MQLPGDRNTLGGTIGGIPAGVTVVLTTGGEDLPLSADGGFTFATPLAAGAAYAVTVKSKPDGTGCVVRNGTGVVAAAAVDTVQVSCAIAGSVTGFWEQDQCNAVPGGIGLTNGWRISQSRPVFVNVGAGGVSYCNAQCTGVGTTMTGPLVGGFTVTQSRKLTTVTLSEQLSCPRGKASAAQKKPKSRKLWGDGKGKFRTKGQYSAATIRGTRWYVEDGCRYTRTKVALGSVNVRDDVKKKTFIVRKGKSYTARARR